MSESINQSSLSSIDEKSNNRDDKNMKKDDVALDEKKSKDTSASMDQDKTNREDENMKKDEEKKEEDPFVLIQIDDDNDKVGEFYCWLTCSAWLILK